MSRGPRAAQVVIAFIHLAVTAWMSYLAPWFLSMGVALFFPGLGMQMRTGIFVVLALGAATMGGAILGRTALWVPRRWQLAAVGWAIAVTATARAWTIGASAMQTSEDLVVAPVKLSAPVIWALGLSAGLYIGGRYLRPYTVAKTTDG